MDDVIPPEENYGPALSLVRRRRWYFFGTIIVYMPAMWAVQKISPTYSSMGIAIGIWIAVLFVTTLLSAITRCPRCGNYFHLHGMTLLYLRRCLHCQLHISGDPKR